MLVIANLFDAALFVEFLEISSGIGSATSKIIADWRVCLIDPPTPIALSVTIPKYHSVLYPVIRSVPSMVITPDSIGSVARVYTLRLLSSVSPSLVWVLLLVLYRAILRAFLGLDLGL